VKELISSITLEDEEDDDLLVTVCMRVQWTFLRQENMDTTPV
jgi:hypothetical protein